MQDLGRSTSIVIVMVGLPATGKTFYSRKIQRYLTWLGYNSKVFTIGNYRRELFGTTCRHEFFDPHNEASCTKRNECFNRGLNDLISFLDYGEVAIYDATNATKSERKEVVDRILEEKKKTSIIFVESICQDEKVVQKNIDITIKNSPDYLDTPIEESQEDFKNRIENIKKVYQAIEDNEGISYIKIIDIGKRYIIHNVLGYLQSKILSFLMNLHYYPRTIYLTRHGESEYNVQNKVGGDCGLTEVGQKYAVELNSFFQNEFDISQNPKLSIFTSTLKRAVQTGNQINLGIVPHQLKTLDEINVGIFDGMTYKEIEEKFPSEFNERKMHKLTYRYPRGESYLDLISRIEPVLFEIERSRNPVIVISHQAVIRCLFAYFHQDEIPQVPSIDIPLHTVIKLEQDTYFTSEQRILIDPLSGKVSRQDEDEKKQKRFFKPKSFINL